MTTTAELVEIPQAAQAARIAEQTYELAQAYTVDSPEMYALAGEELRDIATKAKQLEETRLSLTRPIDESKRRIMDLFRGPLDRLKEAEGLLRQSMLTWKRAEDERIRKAQEEAERKAREEAQRLEAERRAAEEKERAARAEAEAAMKAGDEAAFAAAAQAAEAAAAAREEAEEVAELAAVAPPVNLPAMSAPKATGVSSRATWKAEVVSLAELVKGAAAGLERGDDTLLAYLQADTKALGQVAKALKAQARIPGVRVYAEESLAVRRR